MDFLNLKVKKESSRLLKLFGLNKFFGIWIYESKDDVFILVKKKANIITRIVGERMCLVVGYQSYKKNDVLIEGYDVDCINTITSGVLDKKQNNKNLLSFRFRESKHHVNARGTLAYVKDNPYKLILKLELAEGDLMIKLDGIVNHYKLHVLNNV